MKILVLSDSHGELRYMQRAVALEQPDVVVHLGDCSPDCERLRACFPKLTMYSLPGNCDGATKLAPVVTASIGGKRFLMTHGHRHNVKFGLIRLALDGEAQEADVVLYGHTHVRLCEQRGRMWMLNPGSCRARLSYGVVTIADGIVACRLNPEGDQTYAFSD